MAQCAIDNKPLVFNISESGIWADAVRGRQAVVVNDYQADFAGKHGLPEGHVPLTRLVSVPVFRSGRIVAVGAVANKMSVYTGEDVKTIEEFLTNANIIVQRKRAEDLLRLNEEQYRTVADFTFDWEFWLGLDGRLLYTSPSCKRITGYTPDDFIGDPGLMLSIVHPDDDARVRGHFTDPYDTICENEGIDFRIIRRDGTQRWIGHRCQAVYGYDGRLLGRRGSNRDITDRKRAEEEVLRLNRHIITLQEEERQRVAKDLHDGVSQMLNAAKLNFAAFSQDTEKNRERFDAGMEFIDLASRELREVYSNLYPSVLEDLGLELVRILTGQLRGSLVFNNPGGACCTIAFRPR
jgi:PAS domain S-box-containing protein